MPGLKATQFRVQNYRNIEDSGWIDLGSVTAFVGRNESGKTALLKALHKFNPASPEPYDAQREFPRDRFTRDFGRNEKWPVCSVTFEIAESLRDALAEIVGGQDPPRTVTMTRYYGGTAQYSFEPAVRDLPVAPARVAEALKDFAAGSRRLPAVDERSNEDTAALRADLAEWATGRRKDVLAHASLRSADGVALLAAIESEANAKAAPDTADLVEKLLDEMGDTATDANEEPVSPKVWAFVKQHLPVFIYFENYGTLDSAVYLPRLLDDIQRDPANAKVRTINAMFKHVNLSAQQVTDLGRETAAEASAQSQAVTDAMIADDQRRKELREVILNSASLDITGKFSAWWKQRRHQIRYQADGPYFRIWVSDDRRPGVEIELESRSKGFQWFFSFYLVFLVESDEGHKDAVLLLDEPGLHLHPTAQQELITFFDELAKDNQLLYSTHSPFLIDGDHLERVRPVVEDDDGHSMISNEIWPADRETIFPLQAAAGYAMMDQLFAQAKNLLVEGISDYLYLTSLSIFLRAAGEQGLPDDVYVTPCGGSRMVGNLASLFLAHDVRPVILLDADAAGRGKLKSLMRDLYAGHEEVVLLLSEPLSLEECEIEDVIGEAALLPVVGQLVGAPIQLTDEDRAEGSLPDQVAAAAARSDLQLPEGWRPECARRLVRSWALQDDVPADVLDRARAVVSAINERFAAN